MIGKTVYTVNNKTNRVDEWICNGEITGIWQGSETRLCMLQNGKKQLVLPKRCVFLTRDDAVRITQKKFFN